MVSYGLPLTHPRVPQNSRLKLSITSSVEDAVALGDVGLNAMIHIFVHDA